MGSSKRGLFIVFEGVDGSGTTTQLKLLSKYVSEKYGSLPHTMREPSHYPAGKLVRERIEQNKAFTGVVASESGMGGKPHPHNAEIMALLFAADRLHHMGDEGECHFAINCVVLCDRYDLSSIIYQSNTSSALVDPISQQVTDLNKAFTYHGPKRELQDWIRTLNRFARRPDVTVVLEVSAEVAAERRRARGGPPELFDDADLQRRLVEGYFYAEKLVPGDTIIPVDGSEAEDAVAARVVEVLTPYLETWYAGHREYLATQGFPR